MRENREVRRLKDRISELKALVQMYRPINTCPKAGPVLLLDAYGPQVWEASIYWDAMQPGAKLSAPMSEAKACTHWAPVPPLPESAA